MYNKIVSYLDYKKYEEVCCIYTMIVYNISESLEKINLVYLHVMMCMCNYKISTITNIKLTRKSQNLFTR